MLKAFGYSGPLRLETFLSSVRRVEWLDFPKGVPSRQPGSELDDDVEFSISLASEDLSERPDGVVMDVLRHVLFSVNSSDKADTPEQLELMVRLGYQFNCWSIPSKLRT